MIHSTDPTTSSGVDWLGEPAMPDVEAGPAPQALLAAAEKLSGGGSWTWHLATDRMVWSENVFRILGLDRAAVTADLSHIVERTHPDDRARVEESLAQARQGEPPTELTYRIVTDTGAVRFLHSAVAASLRPQRGPVLVGWLRDLTATRLAEREIAARIAVTAALGQWERFDRDAEHLISALATAMGFSVGVMWLPTEKTLAARVTWSLPGSGAIIEGVGDRRLWPGEGLAGLAWQLANPVTASTVSAEASQWFRSVSASSGVRGAAAIPVIGSGGVLAVIFLGGAEELELTDRLRATLTGIGHEIGAFMERRLGELTDTVLSSRELEILQMAATGLSGPDIANRLMVSRATVKTHFAHIYAKYEVPDRASAVAKAMRAGLIR